MSSNGSTNSPPRRGMPGMPPMDIHLSPEDRDRAIAAFLAKMGSQGQDQRRSTGSMRPSPVDFSPPGSMSSTDGVNSAGRMRTPGSMPPKDDDGRVSVSVPTPKEIQDHAAKELRQQSLAQAHEAAHRISADKDHGVYAEKAVPVDNTKRENAEDGFEATDVHLGHMIASGKEVVTPEMQAWTEKIQRHFQSTAMIQLIWMPGAQKLNSFGPPVGFVLSILDDRNSETKKPTAAPFIFDQFKIGFGVFAAKIPAPFETSKTTDLYSLLMDPARREEALGLIQEFVGDNKLDYPDSTIGFYKSVQVSDYAASEVLWVVVMEGDKPQNKRFHEHVEKSFRDGLDWKGTMFGPKETCPIQDILTQAAKKRKDLAHKLLLHMGLDTGIGLCVSQVDTPHFDIQYDRDLHTFLYCAGGAYVRDVKNHVLAKSPMAGFTIMSGSTENSTLTDVTEEWSGKKEMAYAFPCMTGKHSMLVQHQDGAKWLPDANNGIVNRSGETSFARKLADIHNRHTLDFAGAEIALGWTPILPAKDLMPWRVVIRDDDPEADEDEGMKGTPFEDFGF